MWRSPFQGLDFGHLGRWCQQLAGLKMALSDLSVSRQVARMSLLCPSAPLWPHSGVAIRLPQVHVLRPRTLEAPLVMKVAGQVQAS